MSAPRPLEKLGGAPHSKQSLRLWLRLLSCATVIDKRIRQKLVEEFGTTLPRFDVMAALDRAEAGLTMGELSTLLLATAGNATQLASRMIEDGLVERIPGGPDRRVVRIQLTQAGRDAFRAMAGEHERWIDLMMGDLDDREVDELLQGLDRLRGSLGRNHI